MFVSKHNKFCIVSHFPDVWSSKSDFPGEFDK